MSITSITSSGYHFFNFVVAYTCLVISLVSIGFIFMNRKIAMKEMKYLFMVMVANVIYSFACLFEMFYTNQPGLLVHVCLWIVAFLEYILPYMMAVFLIELMFALSEKKNTPKWERSGMHIFFSVITFVLVYGSISGEVYYITENNYYMRGHLFMMSQIMGLVYIIYIFFLLKRHRDYLTKTVYVSITMYIVCPLIAVVLQMIQSKIFVMLLALTFTGTFITIFLLQTQINRYHLKEKQLAQLNVQIVLSQLRPHFLYNALSSISALCMIDPLQASEMTDQFATFLRKNMSDMAEASRSPFVVELSHLKNYLAIEKLRFEERLNVIYDIKTSDFELPTLILQPLVENSIKHGILPKEEGGTVRIATRETDNMFIVTIADNGIGFDTSILKQKRAECHIGMDSVKTRLEHVSMARLLVSSAEGSGTTYTVIIPKDGCHIEEEENYYEDYSC